MPPDPLAAFVAARTRLRPVPSVPGLRLHQGSGVVGLWEDVEAAVGRTGTEPPFWAFPWAGGQALARYLLEHPQVVAGRRVLDVAAGSGLVAVAAARAGAAAVRANDVDPLALAAVGLNAAANGVQVEVAGGDLLDGDGAPADVVLVGDALYAAPLAARVLPFLRRAAARGATVLVGDPGRAHLPASGLEEVAAYALRVVAELEDRPVRRATVWRVPAPS